MIYPQCFQLLENCPSIRKQSLCFAASIRAINTFLKSDNYDSTLQCIELFLADGKLEKYVIEQLRRSTETDMVPFEQGSFFLPDSYRKCVASLPPRLQPEETELNWFLDYEERFEDEMEQRANSRVYASAIETAREEYYSELFYSIVSFPLAMIQFVEGVKLAEINYQHKKLFCEEHIIDILGAQYEGRNLNSLLPQNDSIELATVLYNEQKFELMPILADALEDAGCDDESILAHCRDPHAVHVRGCWVVDLVLGKS